MMDKIKILSGVLVFGSLWGFSECIIGSFLDDIGLPSGVVMTGVFAVVFLTISRMFYRQPGMQLGMGFIAGALRLVNPFVGCHLCSAIAIMMEGVLFEVLWYGMCDLEELKKPFVRVGMGIVTAYVLFIGGYVVTQILTPIVAGSGFYFENLLVFLPRILSAGLTAALLGGVTLPVSLSLRRLDFKLRDSLYYPTTVGVSAMCWLVVISAGFVS